MAAAASKQLNVTTGFNTVYDSESAGIHNHAAQPQAIRITDSKSNGLFNFIVLIIVTAYFDVLLR